jgi:hypothetical protein
MFPLGANIRLKPPSKNLLHCTIYQMLNLQDLSAGSFTLQKVKVLEEEGICPTEPCPELRDASCAWLPLLATPETASADWECCYK